MNESPSAPTGPSQAPDFKQIRSYLHTIQQREALGGFMRAGWSPSELAEFARNVYLVPGKTYPTAASYRYAMEKGAAHAYAVETLASTRHTHSFSGTTSGISANHTHTVTVSTPANTGTTETRPEALAFVFAIKT